MFKRKVVLETKDLVLSKRFGRYKLIDKNDKHKFRVFTWSHCSSLGATCGYSVWSVSGVGIDKELTPYRGNPRIEAELIKFVKEMDYEKMS